MLKRAEVHLTAFNPVATFPYQLRPEDFQLAIKDVYDLLFDINTALLDRDLKRLEETVRPAIFSGILSDAVSASLAKHSRVLTLNQYHNGHPDLVPGGRYAHDSIPAGDDGVEVKATKGTGAVDAHGARAGWFCVFRYTVDSVTEPAVDRHPTRFTEILLAQLTVDDFRRNARGELGTRTASPNREGLLKLRENWVFRDL